ncbi:MAG: cytochrome c [Bacteroidetes bacterium]|nr:cytochrome c [Rhodothermia bacterium]MCS7155881.1 cytochrome c [Bacteroidota bacterium]MCX7906018.1 cytochrome c [Bacteroidota bacterium]MDW8138146.1 cytochrome c [Bacteroidota bacterium]MDW8285830.1 cytochrome c [Bacteroidota bacterium]
MKRLAWLVLLIGASQRLWAQTDSTETDLVSLPAPRLFQVACARCHGPDGRGYPDGSWRELTALQVPPPDFTDPLFSSLEPLADWIGVIREGGKPYGLSMQMPAFGEALPEYKIRELAEYLKSLGSDPRYLPGELSYPRLFNATKPFPESEALWISSQEMKADRSLVRKSTLYWAQRWGPRRQWELKLTPEWSAHKLQALELELGLKQALAYDRAASWLLSSGLEAALYLWGDEPWTLQPYITGVKGLGEWAALHGSLRLVYGPRADQRTLLRWALGGQFLIAHRARIFAPALEYVGQWALGASGSPSGHLVPQLFFTPPRRGHVAMALGLELPLGRSASYRYRLRGFLLWEFLEGPFWEGW